MQFPTLAGIIFLAASGVAAQQLNITLWNLPNYQAGEGVTAAGNLVNVNIGEDSYLGTVNANLVDSAKIPAGYVCLFFGGYGDRKCIEGEDEFQCVEGDTPVLNLSNTFECIRCFGPGAACPK
ncbi:hypothetical protein L873DRAFT_1814412 [Choiromyces venosus 120613-1]|uniref:Uncharacterized protein n=1 Tax=Choiromyces venosus 120613-1 TaxID=1336337 RepID=A0A3N4JD94_9PEZI|nr:hypothetical protein L873DRAFT_1814412 [Choiromyces venosus 120613-1]